MYGKSITLADREIVEEKADGILSEARESDVAFLVVGDPFGYATFLVCFSFLWIALVGSYLGFIELLRVCVFFIVLQVKKH